MMHTITRKDFTEILTLLIPDRQEDGEGGYDENWRPGPQLWAAVFPILARQEKPHYRLVVGGRLILPYKVAFLWNKGGTDKRLYAITEPWFTEHKRFLSMTVREE